jgi:autoinducer 2-degrading protein
MLVTTVLVRVHQENIQDFINATIENHQHSIKEPGNMRFDLLQSHNEPNCFTLYEAYATEAAAAAHKQTAHYLKWREIVAPWMAQPRKGIAHKVLAPVERDQW